MDDKLISYQVAGCIKPEINLAMCGFCSRWQRQLTRSNHFPYDVQLPEVSEAGYELGCLCSLATRELASLGPVVHPEVQHMFDYDIE